MDPLSVHLEQFARNDTGEGVRRGQYMGLFGRIRARDGRGPMSTFEEGFAAAENAADSVLNTLGDVTRLARQMRKAAQDGNIAAVRRSSERLQDSINLIRQEVGNAAEAWPFTPDNEREYLQEKYAEELKSEAGKKGLQVFDRDGRLIAHPSVVRVMPGDRAVQVNRRQMSAIRPSKVVGVLEDLQQRPPRFNPQQFLDSLYQAYIALTGSGTADRLKLGEVGQVVRLDRIYDLFTGLPGAKRDYGLLDFARDLYSLEASGIKEVRAGTRVSFPASTGTRSSRGTIPFVAPSGETIVYYGIQFTGAAQ